MYRHLLDNLRVAQADILTFPCDVLVLKHAQSFMGADSAVMTALRANTREPQAAVNALRRASMSCWRQKGPLRRGSFY